MKRVRAALMIGGVSAVFMISVPVVSAADNRNCSDFASPIIIVDGFDPDRLDADGDGIGCESNPGAPVTSDLYSDLRGQDDSTLAVTGGNIIERHPMRAYGAAGLAVVVGAATIIIVRRRTHSEGE